MPAFSVVTYAGGAYGATKVNPIDLDGTESSWVFRASINRKSDSTG